MFRDPKHYLWVDDIIIPYYLLEETHKFGNIVGDRSYRYTLLEENKQ